MSMDTAVAIRTLEATYKQSADSVAVESMIAKLTEKVTLDGSSCIEYEAYLHSSFRHTCLRSKYQSHLYWIGFTLLNSNSPKMHSIGNNVSSNYKVP